MSDTREFPETFKSENPKYFNTRDYVTFRNILSLTTEEKKRLDYYLNGVTTAGEFNEVIDTEMFTDNLIYQGIRYEVCYIECHSAQIEDLAEEKMLYLSFRVNHTAKLQVVLVSYKEHMQNIDFSTYTRLNLTGETK